jgi:hypothetical protein
VASLIGKIQSSDEAIMKVVREMQSENFTTEDIIEILGNARLQRSLPTTLDPTIMLRHFGISTSDLEQ